MLVCLTLSLVSPAFGAQGLDIVRFNPKKSTLKVYQSFQEGFLLVSLEPKAPKRFECTPNRYLIYQNKPERFTWISGANLKVSSDFKQVAYLKVLKIGPLGSSDWVPKAKLVSRLVQASPTLLAQTAMQDSDKNHCWQQPVLMQTEGFKETPIPVIGANLCKKRWCSELQFTPQGSLKLWVALEPKRIQMAEFSGDNLLSLGKKSDWFTKESLKLEPVPRKNLLAGKKLEHTQIPLAAGGRLIVKQKKNQVTVTLLRSRPNLAKAKARLQGAKDLLAANQPSKAYQQARFASWLNPKDFDPKYQQLLALAAFAGPAKVFEHLRQDFSKAEQKKACAQLHLDKAFLRLKKQKLFLDQFKQACPSSFSPVF